MHRLLLIYTGSGLVSLAYEVLWTRFLMLEFGISIWAVVMTVCAFLFGLGTGSWWMNLRLMRRQQPLTWTQAIGIAARLELFVALFSTVVPILLGGATPLFNATAAWMSAQVWTLFLASVSFILLTIPACAMGMGFPVMLRLIQMRRGGTSTQHASSILSLAYGFNTLGAVTGALLPLYLLPVLGWKLSVYVVGGIGLFLAWMLKRSKAMDANELIAPVSMTYQDRAITTIKSAVLGGYAVLGATSLMMEVAWSRLFGLLMLRTEYVLAIVLAVILLGISLGSLWMSRLKNAHAVTWLPWISAVSTLVMLLVLPQVSAWVESSHWTHLTFAMLMQGAMIAVLTLPVTICFGAWFVVLSRITLTSTQVDARCSAIETEHQLSQGVQLYAVNSWGAVIGAALTGWVLIPWLGSTGTLSLAVVLVWGVGLCVVGRYRQLLWAPIVIGLVMPWAWLPPIGQLLPMALGDGKDIYQYEDAVAMTQVVERASGERILLTDLQRQDASTEGTSVYVQANQTRLPLLLHPHPQSVLFLGLGTGISAGASMPLDHLQRTVVELSQGAIRAAQLFFSHENHDVLSHSDVIHQDARYFLNASNQSYDVIVGDLFHPDLVGVGNLLSVEQFQRAKRHLKPQGIFVQWIALNQFDQQSLAVVLRTFVHVFPHAVTFIDGMHLALVGPLDALQSAHPYVSHIQSLTKDQQQAMTNGEGVFNWLGRYMGPIQKTPGPLQDEWVPVIDFYLPTLRYSQASASMETLNSMLKYLLHQRPSVEQAAELLEVSASDKVEFERSYIGTDLLIRSWIAGLSGESKQAVHLLGLAHDAHPDDQWVRYAWQDLMNQSKH